MQKKAAVIQDICCAGKCSLTIALPVLSAAGVSCSILPTAVMSTHTGGFRNVHGRDLTEDILAIVRHWKREGSRSMLCTAGICILPRKLKQSKPQ